MNNEHEMETKHRIELENVKQQSALLETLMSLNSTDTNAILNNTATLIAQRFHAQKTDVFLYEEQTHTLVALGVSETPLGKREKEIGLDRLPLVNKGRTVEVFQQGTSHLSGQADKDTEELIGIRQAMGVSSVMAVPLAVNNDRRGVIQVDSLEHEAFSQKDLHLLEGIAYWVGIVVHRIELLQQVQQQALQEGRRTSAENLMMVLAHDVRNYLTPLKARLGLVYKRAVQEQRKQDLEDLGKINISLARFEQLIKDLLDTARLSQGLFNLKWELVDLAQLLETLISLLQTSEHPIEIQLSDTHLTVWADSERLRQAIENVLANALKYSPKGKPVRISVEHDTEWYYVHIIDQGPGIAKDMQSTLFEPFRKDVHSGGLGLGLYLAQRIAIAHGGSLTVTSRPGETRFTFKLPLIER